MHLDLYTSNSALTHKAKFWCNYVGALKDRGPGLLVRENPEDLRPKYKPSIWSQYRPLDITMTDLMFPEEDWRKWEFWYRPSSPAYIPATARSLPSSPVYIPTRATSVPPRLLNEFPWRKGQHNAHRIWGLPMIASSVAFTPALLKPFPRNSPTWNTSSPGSSPKCSTGQRDPA